MCSITLGSLFDGSGGFPLAAQHFDIKTLWSSEIDSACNRVIEKHFPNIAQLGDVRRIDGAEIPPVNIITFGSPCQDLSIAGNQRGLAGERSGLFLEAIRIINQMRYATDGKYPRFAIWENVPGAFSSNKGADFQKVLEAFTGESITMPRPNKRGGLSGRPPEWSEADASILVGAFLTPNTGEYPSEERGSTLSQILEANVPAKFFLSPKACAGILRRAEKRGKKLPPLLEEALQIQAGLNAETGSKP